MRISVILRYVGIVILFNAAFMFISALVSLAGGPDSSFNALLLSAVLTAALGAFPLIFAGGAGTLLMKESYMVVVISWLVACFVGTFPYLLWGGEFSPATAWFESVSGYTTTGATALTNIEALPDGLMFWRSSTHWLGGVGVVLFALTILPSLGGNKMALANMEMSSLARENYRYRVQKIIYILLLLYVGLTVGETILLRIAGAGWFDAINLSFSTVSTGGFSNHTASLAYYDSVWIEGIATVFMLLSGMHFGLLFATLTGSRNNIFRSEVTRFYLATVVFASIFIAFSLWNSNIYSNFGESVRRSLFSVVSVVTTTGLVTTDTNLWTPFSMVILIWLTFQCACAGSTSGGIKSDRILLAFKVLKARLYQQQHPNAVIRIRLNGFMQENSVVNAAMFFIVLYAMIAVAGTIVVTAAGMDMLSGFSMVAACMSNTGVGFGEMGALSNYAHLHPLIKSFCTVLMLLGRLEIFGLIQLFMMKWWR